MVKYIEINREGYNIRCKLYCEALRDNRTVILCPTGFGGHMDNKATERFAEFVLSKYHHTSVLTFNWPCHGNDVRKKLTLQDCRNYLQLAAEYSTDTLGAEKLLAYAVSFGGYMILLHLHESGNPFSKIVLRCPAVNLYDSMTCSVIKPFELEAIAKGKETEVGFDRKVRVTQSFLSELAENDVRSYDYLDYADQILIIHGTDDEIIPYAEIHRFSEEHLIDLVPVEHADHRFRDPLKMDRAIAETIHFFAL